MEFMPFAWTPLEAIGCRGSSGLTRLAVPGDLHSHPVRSLKVWRQTKPPASK